MKHSIFLGLSLLMAGSLYAEHTQRTLIKPVPNAAILPGYRVSLSDKSLLADIAFWLHQFKEHAQFLEILFQNDRHYKHKAASFAKKLEHFRKEFNGSTLTPKEFSHYKKLLKNLKHFQKKALHEAKKKEAGKAFPALINHMTEELDYHIDNIHGKKRSTMQEKYFWTRHDKEVDLVNSLKPAPNSYEDKVLKDLKSHGLSDHEKREDAYAARRIAAK